MTSTTALSVPGPSDDARRPAPFVLDPVAQEALFRSARSVRAWSPEPISDATIEQAYELLRWAPTAINSSPLRLLLVRTPAARERLAGHVTEGNRERVRTAPLSLVLAADVDWHRHLPTLAPHRVDAVAHLEADPEGRERTARANAWLQVGYLIVALRAVGLDVGPMGGMDAAAIDAENFVGSGWRSLMVVNVGWPTPDHGAFPRAARLEPGQALRTA